MGSPPKPWERGAVAAAATSPALQATSTSMSAPQPTSAQVPERPSPLPSTLASQNSLQVANPYSSYSSPYSRFGALGSSYSPYGGGFGSYGSMGYGGFGNYGGYGGMGSYGGYGMAPGMLGKIRHLSGPFLESILIRSTKGRMESLLAQATRNRCRKR
jgi:peroxin-13